MIHSTLCSRNKLLFVFLVMLLQNISSITCLRSKSEQHSNTRSLKNESDEDNRIMVEAYPSWVLLCTQIMPTVLFIDRYFTIISYVLGFPGNIISLLVWTSRCMYRGNSAAIYLAALSINDLIVLLMAFIRDLSRVWDVREYVFPGYCEIKMTTTPAVQYSSPLFVLGFTVERWLAICRPFAIDRICSARRAIYICILIITVTTIICSGNAYIFVTTGHYCEKRDAYSMAANIYLYVLEGIFSGIVPFLVLIFNCLVIRELARINQANKRLAVLSNRLFNTEQQLQTNETSCFGKYCPQGLKFDSCLTASCCNFYGKPNKMDQPVYPFNLPSDRSDNQINGILDHDSRDPNRNIHSTRSSRSRTGDPFKSRQRGSGFSDDTRSSFNSRHNPSFRSTTIMLLVVSFYMIITTMLGGLVYALHQGMEVPSLNLTKNQALQDPIWINYMRVMLIKTIGDEIALSHYAMGFIIYYATGRNFRQRVHQLLRKLCLRMGCHCNFLTKLGMSEDYDLSSTRRRTQKRFLMNDELLTDPSKLSECRNSMTKELEYPKPVDYKRENGNSLVLPTHRPPRRPKTNLLRYSPNTCANIGDNIERNNNSFNIQNNTNNYPIMDNNDVQTENYDVHTRFRSDHSHIDKLLNKVSIDSTEPFFPAYDISIQPIDS